MKTVIKQYCSACPRWAGKETNCKKCDSPTESKNVPNRRSGLYYIESVDVPLPSVTSILDIIAKPELDYWKRKKVAEAIAADPDLSVENAIKAPDLVRDKAATLGSDIHHAIATGQNINPADYLDPWKGFVEAYRSFNEKMPHKVIAAEQVVFSTNYRYAGQYDAVIEFADGKKYLIDYKTSKNIYPKTHSLQLSAYRAALPEGVDGIAVVHLKPEGSFVFHELAYQPKAWLACLALYKYLKTE